MRVVPAGAAVIVRVDEDIRPETVKKACHCEEAQRADVAIRSKKL